MFSKRARPKRTAEPPPPLAHPNMVRLKWKTSIFVDGGILGLTPTSQLLAQKQEIYESERHRTPNIIVMCLIIIYDSVYNLTHSSYERLRFSYACMQTAMATRWRHSPPTNSKQSELVMFIVTNAFRSKLWICKGKAQKMVSQCVNSVWWSGQPLETSSNEIRTYEPCVAFKGKVHYTENRDSIANWPLSSYSFCSC